MSLWLVVIITHDGSVEDREIVGPFENDADRMEHAEELLSENLDNGIMVYTCPVNAVSADDVVNLILADED